MDTEARPKMTYKGESWTVTVPPGTYFLGDISYAVPRDRWMPLIESAGYFGPQPVGTTPGGHEVLGFYAPDVPGRFTDRDGTEYLCDSGLLGLVPEALYSTVTSEPVPALWGRVVTFDSETACRSDGESYWVFGTVRLSEAPEAGDGR